MEFEASRPDGRSDRQIIYELARTAEPGVLFTHEQLLAALQDGITEPIAHSRVYRAVAVGNKTLLREEKRYLGVVRGRGYKVLAANEHLPAALQKKDTAETLFRRGIDLLRDVRADDLTPAERQLFTGTAMIWQGVVNVMRESSRRHDRMDSLIDDLRSRVERLEDRPPKRELAASP